MTHKSSREATASLLLLSRFLLVSNNLLNTNSGLDRDDDTVLAPVPSFADLIRQSLGVSGEVQIGFLVTTFVHKSQFITININNFPVRLVDNGNGGTVGRGNHIFQLLSRENINGGKVALSVTVLSGLGDGDTENLAGVSLDHHVTVAKAMCDVKT